MTTTRRPQRRRPATRRRIKRPVGVGAMEVNAKAEKILEDLNSKVGTGAMKSLGF